MLRTPANLSSARTVAWFIGYVYLLRQQTTPLVSSVLGCPRSTSAFAIHWRRADLAQTGPPSPWREGGRPSSYSTRSIEAVEIAANASL